MLRDICVLPQGEGQEARFLCKCSFLEIYKEVISDLLNPAATRLQIREDLKRGMYVEGLAQEVATSGEPVTVTPTGICSSSSCAKAVQS